MNHSCTAKITGTTDVYLIPGDPVDQVRAPEVFNLIFARLGINAVLAPVHVGADEIAAFVKTAFMARNIKGMFFAIPHKALVMDLLDDCGELGRAAGAINALRRNDQGRLQGDLFDGEGLIAALNLFAMAYQGKKVLILGAGGGASAIGASLAQNGAARISFYDPVPGKAARVAARIAEHFNGPRLQAAPDNDPSGYDLIINASPLGLNADDPSPCDATRLEPHACVMDILMKNQPTPLVRAVRARGLIAQPGFEMLIQQTPRYLDFFGYHDAAQVVRNDANFIRKLIYPAQMQHEIADALKLPA